MNEYGFEYTDLGMQQMPLPMDIERVILAGNYKEAEEMIAIRLADDKVPEVMKKRLRIERYMMQHTLDRYTVSAEDAVRIMAQRGVPDFTIEELERLRKEGTVDWRYIEGEIRYLDSFAGSLIKVYPAYAARVTPPKTDSSVNVVADMVAGLQDGDLMSAHIHIRHNLDFDEEAAQEGRELIVHLPVPKEGIGDQMKHIQILATSHKPVSVAAGDSLQPTICFREKAVPGLRVFVEYALDHEMIYHDMAKVDPETVAQAEMPEEVKNYLEEKLPHIVFTPFMKALSEEILQGETNLLKAARLCYDYVTTKVVYRFAPDYSAIPNVSEYCVVNGKGDCGIQALLLITLMRLAGIPAHWQSGLGAEPDDVGEHDWVRFYLPSLGWLSADPSMGGAAYRRGDEARWNFYFGNMDPFRLPLNEGEMEEWCPVKNYARADSCDSQSGEAEYADGPCPGDWYHRSFEDLGIRLNQGE